MDDFPKATDDHLTVSAWVMASRWVCDWPQIVGNWGFVPGQFHFGLFERDYDLAVKIMQRNGELLVVREENPRFPLGVWQHVAFVVDGTELRLYRNGREVATGQCRGLRPNSPIHSLGIGCKTTTSGDTISGKNWHGSIDELALFNRALSAEEIRRLYEGKSAGGGEFVRNMPNRTTFEVFGTGVGVKEGQATRIGKSSPAATIRRSNRNRRWLPP